MLKLWLFEVSKDCDHIREKTILKDFVYCCMFSVAAQVSGEPNFMNCFHGNKLDHIINIIILEIEGLKKIILRGKSPISTSSGYFCP